MQKRWELGLPLVSGPRISDIPNNLQEVYQEASVRAAREVGELILAAGNIHKHGAISCVGDTRSIIEALDAFDVPTWTRPRLRRLWKPFISPFRKGCIHGRASN